MVCGVVVHVNLTTVDTVNNEQHISYNTMSSVYDLAEAIGFFNVSGNVFSIPPREIIQGIVNEAARNMHMATMIKNAKKTISFEL